MMRGGAFLCLLIVFRPFAARAAPLNFNVRTSWLRNLLGAEDESFRKNSTQQDTNKLPKTDKSRIKLDLSGRYHLLVSEPSARDAAESADVSNISDLRPLFRLGRGESFWPSMFATLQYDFGKAWYGATRLIGNAQWKIKSTRGAPLLPMTVTIRSEQGLLRENNDQAVQLDLGLEAPAELSAARARFSARVDSQGTGTISIIAPLHRRLDVIWKSVWTGKATARAYDFCSHWKSAPTLHDDDWWMPQVQVSTAGRLLSRNRLALRARDRFVGVTLLVSHQLGWNAFGMPATDSDDEQETQIRLEVGGMDTKGSAYSTVIMETALQRIRESTHFALRHEQVHS